MKKSSHEWVKEKKGSAQTVHLNSDAMAAIESLKIPGSALAIRPFLVIAKATIHVHGFIPAWKILRSSAASGTRTGTSFAHGCRTDQCNEHSFATKSAGDHTERTNSHQTKMAAFNEAAIFF
jgi:hypothetical protein